MRGKGNTPGKARVYGRPKRSKRTTLTSTVRSGVAAYRLMPVQRVLVLGVLLVAVVGAISWSQNITPQLPMGVATLALVVLHLMAKFPSITATLLVLTGFFPLVAAIGTLYSLAASQGRADVSTAGLTLAAASLLTAMLAHRTSIGRPWITTLLALVAMTLIGPLLLVVVPFLGFSIAYALAGLVLALRAGGIGWLKDQYTRLLHRLRRGKPDGESVQLVEEERTAAHLVDLDDRHVVLHSLDLPGGVHADHLVIGPAGVFLIDSQMRAGKIREDGKRGLVHLNEPLADSFNALLTVRARVAKDLRVAADTIQPLVVIHDAVLPADRARVALFNADGNRVGDVVVLAPTALNGEIQTGIEVLSKRRVSRLARRARRRLWPALAGTPDTNEPQDTAVLLATEAAVLDADGNRKEAPADPDATVLVADENDEVVPKPLFTSTVVDTEVTVGQKVSILTDQGAFRGQRVCGTPVTQDDGVITVALCAEGEWRLAHSRGEEPEAFPFPLASVEPEALPGK